MGRLRAISVLFAVLAAGLLLAACGSGGNGELLPGATADQITSNLDLVRESAENGNCETAETAVAEVSTEVDELAKVNTQLKSALRQGAAKLSEVVSTCGQAQEEAEQKKAAEQEAKEQEQLESEQLAEEEAFEQEQKEEEREEKANEKAEKEAEQPEPPTEGEESGPNGKAKGHEKQEEIEPPVEEVTPPGEAGGIGPGASVEGSG